MTFGIQNIMLNVMLNFESYNRDFFRVRLFFNIKAVVFKLVAASKRSMNVMAVLKCTGNVGLACFLSDGSVCYQ